MHVPHQGGGLALRVFSRQSVCVPRCVTKMFRLEEKMEMQGAPTGINDGVTAILVTSAKAPIKVGKRVFFEVAFRTTRPCQNMFELIETLGIDLVSDNDQSGIGPSARWTLSAHEQGVREKPRHRWHIGKIKWRVCEGL